MKKYFLKLKTGEKFEVSKVNFDKWLHHTSGDFIIEETKHGNNIYIRFEEVSLGFDLNETKETTNKK
ncbi:MAG: hypothetical protein ACRC4M_02385 [Mycoplasma sp.]